MSAPPGDTNRALTRKWLARTMQSLLVYVSMLENGRAAVDRLKGPEGEKRLARIINFILKELGYEIETPLADASNRVRRAVAGVLGPKE
jgi:hypothetical protein